MLTKITVEAALNAGLDDHLGYERHQRANANNSRNGFTSKTEEGEFELNTPRERRQKFFIRGYCCPAITNQPPQYPHQSC